MLVHFNTEIDFSKEKVWSVSNGATRRVLNLINKLGEMPIKADMTCARIGFLDTKHQSYIFLNRYETIPKEEEVVGVFLCQEHGYSIINGDPIFENCSVGGYGNSESKFGIYRLGTILEVHSYKFRQPPVFYELKQDGWIEIKEEQLLRGQINYVR